MAGPIEEPKEQDHVDACAKPTGSIAIDPLTTNHRLNQPPTPTQAARFGTKVYARAIVEFSNVCTKDCLYCGIRKHMHKVVQGCLFLFLRGGDV